MTLQRQQEKNILQFCEFQIDSRYKWLSFTSRFWSPQDSKWAAPSEFVTYRLCEQRRFRRACASAQSRQNLRCSLIQAVNQEEPSDRKPDPWPLWMAGHAQLKFVMTECSKTQIRLARPKYQSFRIKRTHSRLFRTALLRICKWVWAVLHFEPRHEKTCLRGLRPA